VSFDQKMKKGVKAFRNRRAAWFFSYPILVDAL